ncbi:pyridoxamine 5'-phosphate oxidase [Rubrobacter indicoceani]|uniref:pyridoxamine 5'-phosphate oxidase n=1 Tax=Rubrobacter indicoceani TaxID=2051957 RepID=UPI001F089363|nr:pyridoxamine 5'-phosphate oxidase [Rubrobacter indicoceani]
MSDEVVRMRRDYTRGGLSEGDLAPGPVEQFGRWLDDAFSAGLDEPYAMTLATATPDGTPSARVVLLRGYDRRGFVFYTNYQGRKGLELEENPKAALVFYWGELERQVRVEGGVERVSGDESDAYFASRPRGSRIGAWASEQSRDLKRREALEAKVAEVEERFPDEVSRPPFWGGYRLVPRRVEFWQGRESRLHDRLVYEADRGKSGWGISRLQP